MNTSAAVNPRTNQQGDCLSTFIYTASLLWLVVTSLVRFSSTLFASAAPGPESNQFEMTAALLHAFSLLIPFAALARWWPNPRYRKIYQAWHWTAWAILFGAPAYFFAVEEAQWMAVAQIGLFLVFIALLHRQQRSLVRKNSQDISFHSGDSKPDSAWIWFTAAGIGFASLAAWVRLGALGSLLDTLLFLTLAIELSYAAVLLIQIFLADSLQKRTRSTFGDYILAAIGIGAVLQILLSATAFPFGGMHILLWLCLPVLGWSLAAMGMLSREGAAWQPAPPTVDTAERLRVDTPSAGPSQVAPTQPPTGQPSGSLSISGAARLLLTLCLAGPLLFIDADELALVISSSPNEILFVAMRSATLSFFVGLVAGLALMGVLAGRMRRNRASTNAIATSAPTTLAQDRQTTPNSLRWVSLVVVLSAGALAGYWLFGQPGLHGERMLIILDQQLDVSQAAQIQDYPSRRQYVYDELTQQAQQTQTSLRQFLDRLHLPYTSYYLLNAIETIDNPILRGYLLTRPDVGRILDSPRLRPLPDLGADNLLQPDQPAPVEVPWNISLIGADKVWQALNVSGRGILIGQSDSGVQGDHPDLAAQYRGAQGDNNYNWFDPWFDSPTPVDMGGHGTHTLGTALGKKTGVAPQAQWIACVNLARNLGNPAFYLDCMQFMLAPFPQGGDPLTEGVPSLGAHVLNNSWGCPEFEGCDPQVFLPTVQALEAAGIFVVSAAGNDGPGCSTVNSPLSLYQAVFTVGAIDSMGNLAPFSSLGPVLADESQRTKPDLVAPGVEILSTLPNSSYGVYSGTSMASPHVAGVVALLWSANPDLIGDVEATRAILTASTQPYSGYLPECVGADQKPSTATGYGILDAFAAVQMALGNP